MISLELHLLQDTKNRTKQRLSVNNGYRKTVVYFEENITGSNPALLPIYIFPAFAREIAPSYRHLESGFGKIK